MTDDVSGTDPQKKVFCCAVWVIVIGGFFLFGYGLENLNYYNDWSDALEGECMYESGVKVGCSGNKSCSGKKPAHIYSIRNTSNAFDLCATSTFIEDDVSCACPGNNIPPPRPSGDNGQWRTCYVRDCGSVWGGVRFDEYTIEDYNTAVIMITFGLLMIICPFCFGLYMSKRAAYAESQQVHSSEMEQNTNTCGSEGDVSKMDEIGVWLKSIGEEYYTEYYGLFIQNGFNKTDDLCFQCLNESDLKNVIGIDKMGHRRKILMEIQKMKIP